MIDIHSHGLGGLDTRTENPDDILRIADLHGAAGTDAIMLTIYPQPIDTMRANLLAVKGAMECQSSEFGVPRLRRDKRSSEEGAGEKRIGEDRSPACLESRITNYRSRPLSTGEVVTKAPARILGAHLEGPFLNPLRAGALDAASFLTPSAYDLDRLLDGFEEIVGIITVAPELPGALNLIRSLTDKGIIAGMGHSDATFAEAEAGYHAGARGVTHLFNAMRGFHHREPGLAGFALRNADIYVEIIADPFHLHEEALELIFSVKGHDRIMIVSDSVKETGTRSPEAGLSDAQDRLRGGSLTLRQSSDRLLGLGYDKGFVARVTSSNQRHYLKLRG